VILYPPNSGVPDRAERFLLQFPLHEPVAPASKALVIAFHPFGVSEKSPFNATALPFLCAQKRYLLLAPYGLVDTNYACAPSQQALDAILALLGKWIAYDKERVYAIGFSMGGLNALSYAARHQDPAATRIAALIDHTGTADPIRAYQQGGAELKALLEDPLHFGGSPTSASYAWQRIAPVRIGSQGVEPLTAQVENLLHVPMWIHWNPADPFQDLVHQTVTLRNWLILQGAQVQSSTAVGTLQHAWSTLPMEQAFEWLDDQLLATPPAAFRAHRDAPGGHFEQELRDSVPQQVARWRFDGTGPTLRVRDTLAVRELAFDPHSYGGGAALTLELSGLDANFARLVLLAQPNAPAQVQALTGPAPLWFHDPQRAELTLLPQGPSQVLSIVP